MKSNVFDIDPVIRHVLLDVVNGSIDDCILKCLACQLSCRYENDNRDVDTVNEQIEEDLSSLLRMALRYYCLPWMLYWSKQNNLLPKKLERRFIKEWEDVQKPLVWIVQQCQSEGIEGITLKHLWLRKSSRIDKRMQNLGFTLMESLRFSVQATVKRGQLDEVETVSKGDFSLN